MVPLKSDGGGVVTVPAAQALRSLELRSHRFAPLEVRRSMLVDAAGDGPGGETLSITLTEAGPATLRVVTPDGRPLPGMHVALSRRGSVSPVPGSTRWTVAPASYAAITGADGRAHLRRVPRGEWIVETQLAPRRTPAGLSEVVEPCGWQRVSLTGDGPAEAEVVVDELRSVHLSVFDASNGNQLPGFQVTSREACKGSFADVPGHVWTSWVPRAWPSLSVTADGYGSAEVPLGTRSSYEVTLWPSARGRVRVNGGEGLAGTTVELRVLQRGSDGSMGSMTEVWSSRVELGPELEADFHVPIQDGVVVSLEPVSTASGKVEFRPEYAPWFEGQTVEFTAVGPD